MSQNVRYEFSQICPLLQGSLPNKEELSKINSYLQHNILTPHEFVMDMSYFLIVSSHLICKTSADFNFYLQHTFLIKGIFLKGKYPQRSKTGYSPEERSHMKEELSTLGREITKLYIAHYPNILLRKSLVYNLME